MIEPLGATMVLGLAGVSVAVGNLIAAGMLAEDRVGLVNAVQATAFFFAAFSTLGIAQTLPRAIAMGGATHQPTPWLGLLRRTLLWVTAPFACLVGLIVGVWHGWGFWLSGVTAVWVAGLGAAAVAGNVLRATGRPIRGQMVLQSWRLMFLPLVGLWVVLRRRGWEGDEALYVLLVAASVVAIFVAVRGVRAVDSGETLTVERFRSVWREARHFLGISVSLAVLNYLDRLVVPTVLGLEAMAQYSVVWWLVGTPFTLLQASIGFTLLPRLRRLKTPRDARWTLQIQTGFLALMILVGAGAAIGAVPWLLRVLYQDRFAVGGGLVAAITGVGVLRVLYAIPSSVVGAWSDHRTLAALNWWGWPAAAIALIGSVAGGVTFGVVGVAVGVSLGLLVRIAGAAVLAIRSWTLFVDHHERVSLNSGAGG